MARKRNFEILPLAEVLRTETVQLPFLGFYESAHMTVPDDDLESVLEDMDFSRDEEEAIWDNHYNGTDWKAYKLEIAKEFAYWFLSEALGDDLPSYEVELCGYNDDFIQVRFFEPVQEFKDFKPMGIPEDRLLLMLACASLDIDFDYMAEDDGDLPLLEIEDIFIDYAKANGIYHNAFFKHHKSENYALVWHVETE